ncbi:unnamed protein product [Mycetohabitans rhizoxinica HKI 454]|uniref:Uncharacterized protein n=1 Tax=Mycetohabitans rhizoxinica (strain DSM 19002 / CIP 109453 / HKI 454) TaxID=882378 RepID=E5ARB9_MYCRK|nr:unnamed protein product [Mycetohabitans rhizoxinica HKI 454]
MPHQARIAVDAAAHGAVHRVQRRRILYDRDTVAYSSRMAG